MSSSSQVPFQIFDAIIIGAGAAGLFCAAQAGQQGLKVLLIDHEEVRRVRDARHRRWVYGPDPGHRLSVGAILGFEAENPTWTVMELSRHTEPEALRAVVRLMSHPDPHVRHEAALSAGTQGNVAAVPTLIALLDDHEDDPRWSACWALVDIWTQDAIAVVRRVLSGETGDRHMRDTVAKAMEATGRVLE